MHIAGFPMQRLNYEKTIPRPLGPKEIDGLLVPLACPGKGVQVKPSIHNKLYWLTWVVIFEALFGCHDILVFG